MNLQKDLNLRLSEKRGVHFVVETPKGSGIKYAYDPKIESFTWSRPLIAGLCFPYDFGFLPQTIGDDGDALDAMLLTDVASHPGIVVASKVIGALRIEQYREGQPTKRNDRIMLLPIFEHRQGEVEEIEQLSQRVREEMEAFCMASLVLTGKVIKLCGWAGHAEAEALISQASARYLAL